MTMRAFALFLALLLLPIGAFAQTNGPYGPILGLAQSYGNSALFGTGADGNLSCNSGTTTLTRDMNYANLTLTGTCSIRTNGYQIHVSGLLDLSSAPTNAIIGYASLGAGPSGSSGGSGGGGGFISVTVPFAGFANAAGNGGTTTGGNSNAGQTFNVGFGANGATGGTGGTGASGAGGSAGAGSTITSLITWPNPGVPILVSGLYYLIAGNVSGTGGGGGGGDGTNAGGGGGQPMNAGGSVVIAAATINRSAGTATGAISCKPSSAGGTGANGTGGNSGGGGGGAGGAGGFCWVLAGQLTGAVATNAVDVSGSNGGTGGNGVGTGTGGTGGTGGRSGLAEVIVLNPPSHTASTPNTAGSAGSGPTGATGGAGGAGAVSQQNL